jgi:NADH-quinone oxidoreductase subunit L
MNWIGAITALIAALAALSQYDIKRILAYSTISQLGLMMTDPYQGPGFLHLTTHAFFKAGLFLAAGAIIHALHQAQHHSPGQFDVQDIRNLGGLRKRLPFTFLAFIICGAALGGLPFTSGFLSKEALILMHLLHPSDFHNKVIASIIFLTSFITVIYTFRLIWFVFFGKERHTQNLTVNEAPWVMRMPIAVLMIGSGWFVYSINPFDAEGWLLTSIFGVRPNEFSVPYLALGTTIWVGIALTVAYLMYRKRTTPSHIDLFKNGFGIDWFTTFIVSKTSLAAATTAENVDRRLLDKSLHFIAYANVTFAHLIGWFDRNIIDGSVHAVAAIARGIGSFTRSFQSGKIQMYIFWAALALIIFIIWILI